MRDYGTPHGTRTESCGWGNRCLDFQTRATIFCTAHQLTDSTTDGACQETPAKNSTSGMLKYAQADNAPLLCILEYGQRYSLHSSTYLALVSSARRACKCWLTCRLSFFELSRHALSSRLKVDACCSWIFISEICSTQENGCGTWEAMVEQCGATATKKGSLCWSTPVHRLLRRLDSS